MSNLKVEYIDHMGSALTVVNAARVSFGNTKTELDDKDKKLIKYLADHQHMSPFEHCTLTVKVTCPLYIRSQIHRHRTFCLSGDTEITFNRPAEWKKGVHVKQIGNKGQKFTLTRLFKLWNNPVHKSRLQKMLIRCYDEKAHKFTVSNLTDVIYSGKKHIFELETESGKKLKCTKDHKLLTDSGWQRLEDAVGLELTKNNIATMSKQSFVITNGELVGLSSLDESCHRVVHKKHALSWRVKSKGNILVGKKEKIVSVRYVGEEITYDLSVKGPNHNFVANGMVVHNSYNEVSRRYTEKNMEFYLPDEYRKQHKSNRQASEGALAEEHQQALKIEVAEHHAQSLKLYEDMLAMGVCKEQARGVLPQDLITEFYMTGNLRNWVQFIKLRDHEGAQYEVQLLAQQVREILIDKFEYPAEVLCGSTSK
jgi:thymidylate synthase (FAD)